MEKAEITKLLKELKANITATHDADFMSQNAREMPLLSGEVYVLTRNSGKEEATPKWSYILTDDGGRISTSQLIRKRNGLPLSGKTNDELTDSFFALFGDKETIKVKVTSVRERTSIGNDGLPYTTRYATFELVQ